jgi:hypothetical protein
VSVQQNTSQSRPQSASSFLVIGAKAPGE